MFHQTDPGPAPTQRRELPFLIRFIRRHLLYFAVAVGFSFALIYFETTSHLFFVFDGPRQGGDPCLSLIRPTTGPDSASVWANFGSCAEASRDPDRETIVIDLRYGLLRYYKTHAILRESLPLPFTLVLRNRDHMSRAFGRGGSHTYNMALVGDSARLSWVDLILGNGGRIHYLPTGERGWFDSEVSGYFAESKLQWTGRDWRLKRDDGNELVFPESQGATRLEQAALIGIQAADESVLLAVDRDDSGNLRSLRTGDRHVDFEYDSTNRVTVLTDDSGRRVEFEYDASGCLVLQKSAAEVFQYTQDNHESGCRLRIASHNGVAHFRADYDAEDRVARLTDPAGGIYSLSYETDGRGKVTRVHVIDPDGAARRISLDERSYWINRWGAYRGQ